MKEGDGCGTELARRRIGAPRRVQRAPVVRAGNLQGEGDAGEVDGGALPAALHHRLLDASTSGPIKPHERVIFNPQS